MVLVDHCADSAQTAPSPSPPSPSHNYAPRLSKSVRNDKQCVPLIPFLSLSLLSSHPYPSAILPPAHLLPASPPLLPVADSSLPPFLPPSSLPSLPPARSPTRPARLAQHLPLRPHRPSLGARHDAGSAERGDLVEFCGGAVSSPSLLPFFFLALCKKIG